MEQYKKLSCFILSNYVEIKREKAFRLEEVLFDIVQN